MSLATTITPLTLENFNSSITITQVPTFYDAAAYLNRSGDGQAFLFGTGCGPHRNCTVACTNPEQAFGDGATLLNCMQYPYIARSLKTLDLESLQFAHEMGIQSDMNATEAYGVLADCLNSFYNDTPRNPLLRNSSDRPPCLPQTLGQCYPDICDPYFLYAPLNGDVGGIGVFVSYFMQCGLSLLIFLGIKLSVSWAYWISWIFTRAFGTGFSARWTTDIRKTAKKHLDPIVAAAIDFHKAQCLFMLAIQMAALIVLHRNNLLDAWSLQQLYQNYFLIGCVSIGGFLPISFTLACLQIAGTRSWYLWLLSGFTMTVSASTMFVSNEFLPQVNDVTGTPPPSNQCGAANPVKLCLLQDHAPLATWTTRTQTPGPAGSGGAGNSILAFSTLVLFLCLVDLCLHTFERFRNVVRRANTEIERVTHAKTFRSLEQYREDFLKYFSRRLDHIHLGAFFCWILYLGFLAGYAFFFYQYSVNLQRPFGSTPVTKEWTFGQIVAITIWAPSIFEFFYLEIVDLPKGFAHKMTKRFKLVEVEEHPVESLRGRSHHSLVSDFLQHPWITMLNIDYKPVHQSDGNEGSPLTDHLRSNSDSAPSIPPLRRMTSLRGDWDEEGSSMGSSYRQASL